MTSAEAEDIRFALRNQTRREHEVLDSHPAFAAMTHGTLSLAQYRGIMGALHKTYRLLDPIVEEACFAHHAEMLGFTYAPREHILADDLARLGGGYDVPAFESNPLPAIASAAALGGVLYVIEGSVLGGAMLHRSTSALLGDGEDRGNGYWAWCAREGKSRWAMTCRLLTALDADPGARAAMIQQARLAFGLISRAFEPLARDMTRESAAC